MYVPEPPVADAWNATFNGVVPDVGLAEHDTVNGIISGETTIVGQSALASSPLLSLTVTVGWCVPVS